MDEKGQEQHLRCPVDHARSTAAEGHAYNQYQGRRGERFPTATEWNVHISRHPRIRHEDSQRLVRLFLVTGPIPLARVHPALTQETGSSLAMPHFGYETDHCRLYPGSLFSKERLLPGLKITGFSKDRFRKCRIARRGPMLLPQLTINDGWFLWKLL
jgi:hypothetical protein